jgi:hypothetical protein
MMIAQTLDHRRRFSWFKLSFVIVSHSSWCFVSDLHSLRRVRIICANFKTIKSFVKWSQNDQVLSNRTFWIFISRLKFLFRIQFVHAKTTLNCDRKYYKKRDDDQWWWSTNDLTRFVLFLKRKCFHTFRFHNSIFLSSSNFYVLFIVIIIFCLSR